MRLIISTVQCAHTGIVVKHGGKMNLKKKVWFLEVLNISFYFEVCVIKLQKVYELVEKGDVDHFSENLIRMLLTFCYHQSAWCYSLVQFSSRGRREFLT